MAFAMWLISMNLPIGGSALAERYGKVSRSSKTPTSIYLASRGIQSANVLVLIMPRSQRQPTGKDQPCAP